MTSNRPEVKVGKEGRDQESTVHETNRGKRRKGDAYKSENSKKLKW
jgi:hypothetical protein